MSGLGLTTCRQPAHALAGRRPRGLPGWWPPDADPLRVGEVGQDLLISGGEPESHCHEGDDTKMVSLTTLGSVIVERPGSLRVSV